MNALLRASRLCCFEASSSPLAQAATRNARRRLWTSPASTPAEFSETRSVPFSCELVSSVVADVDAYDTFVPWCSESRVVRRFDERTFTADLSIKFAAYEETYRSKVLVEPGVRVTAIAVDSSLFETLTNVWTFQDVKAPGQCLLTCTIAYKFRSTLYNMQSSMFTNVVASKMVDAFAKRCEEKA